MSRPCRPRPGSRNDKVTRRSGRAPALRLLLTGGLAPSRFRRPKDGNWRSAGLPGKMESVVGQDSDPGPPGHRFARLGRNLLVMSTQPSSQLLSILRQIQDNPDDDFLRETVLADWLSDHGEADRAEFIRIQCRLERMDDDSVARAELERQEAGLIQHGQESWLGPLRSIARGWSFGRGLIEELDCFLPDLTFRAVQARGWAEFWPWVRSLKIDFREELLTPPLCSLLPLIPGLDVSGRRLPAPAVRALLASSWLSELRLLRMRCDPLAEEAGGLLALAFLPNLREWHLGGAGIGTEGARLLAAAAWLSNLQVFHLWDNQIGPAGAEALAGSPYLARLRELRLGNNRIESSGAHALARSPYLANLRVLDLWSNQIGDAGAWDLSSSPQLSRLLVLDLANNAIGDAGARALRRLLLSEQSPRSAPVEQPDQRRRSAGPGFLALPDPPASLRLGDNPIEAGAERALRKRFGSVLVLGFP